MPRRCRKFQSKYISLDVHSTHHYQTTGSYPFSVKEVSCLTSAKGEMGTSKSIPQNFALAKVGDQKYLEWTG